MELHSVILLQWSTVALEFSDSFRCFYNENSVRPLRAISPFPSEEATNYLLGRFGVDSKECAPGL
ncbi:hypothetical protein TNCV_4524221, partial [Trichonephila clavipes]